MTTAIAPKVKASRMKLISSLMPVFGLITIILLATVCTGGSFLNSRNLASLFNQCFLLMLACVGSIFLFAQGGIDMSITSTISLCSICAAYTIQYGIVVSILASLAAGLLMGVLNGLIYSRTHISVFVQTLSINLLLDGLLYSMTNQNIYISIPRAIQKTYNQDWIKLAILIAFSLLTLYLYRYTTFGKRSRAIGAGMVAAEQSGVNVRRVKMGAFLYTGLAAALYGVCIMVKSGSGGPTAGMNVGFNVMIAMILGGTTTQGGLMAKFSSCFIGVMITAVLVNALSMVGIPSMMQEIAKGVIFVIVMVSSFRMQDKAGGQRYVVRKKARDSER